MIAPNFISTVLFRVPLVRNEVLTSPPGPTWYVIPLTWNVLVKNPKKKYTGGLAYLLRGVNDAAISQSTIRLEKLGLVLEPKLMVYGVSRVGFPLYKLIVRCKVRWNEPFSVNVCVQLDLVRISVVGGNFCTKV